MKARILAIAFLVSASLASAQQIDSSLHVNQFPGTTVAAKVANAMATCPAYTGVPCILVIDPSLAPMTSGTLPTLCSHCYLMDYRDGPPPGPAAPGPLNAKTYGAIGNGTADDTAALQATSNALPGTGAAVFIPGGIYKISGTVTFPQSAVDVGGNWGTSNNGTEPVTEILCTSGTSDCLKFTGENVHVHDIAFVNSVGESGTAPTGGEAIDYCTTGSDPFPSISLDNVMTMGFNIAVQICAAEAGHISNSYFFDSYYDGLLLGDYGSSNTGDLGIVNDVFTCAGTSNVAAIDYEGVSGGRIINNLFDQGISPENADCQYDIYAGIAGPDYVEVNHFEHFKSRAYYGQAPALFSGNQVYTNDSPYGPALEITGVPPHFAAGMNFFEDANPAQDACAIQFDGSSFSGVVIDIQMLAAYQNATCGMTGWWGIDGNADLSPLQNYTLPNLTLDAASGSAGTLATNDVTSPTGYPLVLESASGQGLRVSPGGTLSYLIGSTYLSPASDDTVNLGGIGNAWTSITAYFLQADPTSPSSLPTCGSSQEGEQMAMKNSSTNTWGATVATGGSDHVLAYCDGTNWTVEAK